MGENRVRGRIKKPAGWISILNMEDGARWAVKKGQPMPEKVSKKRAADEAKKAAILQKSKSMSKSKSKSKSKSRSKSNRKSKSKSRSKSRRRSKSRSKSR